MSRVEALADAFSLPDLRDGNRVHLNSIGIANELRRRTGSVVIPTLTLRDSNKHNLLGAVSFAIFVGIDNLLFVRGDPYEENDLAPKNVYDIRKLSSLISKARKLESHVATEHPLCIISPINLAKAHDQNYMNTIKEREYAGIDIFLAEQMFDDIDSYVARVETVRKFGISKPIIHSIFPLKDYEDALACVNKFGWGVSEFELANLKSKGSAYGIEMARSRYRGLLKNRHVIEGVSISTRGNPEVARYVFR